MDGELLVVESAAHRLIRPVTAGRLRQVLGRAAAHRAAGHRAGGAARSA